MSQSETQSSVTPDSVDLDRIQADGLSYEAYLSHWEAERTADLSEDADADTRRMQHYLNYNHERQAGVHDAYTPSDDLKAVLNEINQPITWMVLTEPWCGDSAFSLPIIAEAAQAHPQSTLRILLRDSHLDMMDRFLTGGSRSIPKLVLLDATGTVFGTWGPRPEPAQALYDRLNADGKDKMAIVKELLDWYDEGSWEHVDRELADVLRAVVPTASAA